jgi:pilus assembly protein FimV
MSNTFFKRGVRKHGLSGLMVLALWLASTAAMALGLGEIRVRSQPGQPLVAEIPIISNQPGELEQLQARLASPGTFERVGLERPEGLVSSLDFAVALSDEGRPVIRVTSVEPVQVDAVNFLIEVDWGQGRLVREYSALVSGPGTLAAGSQPMIEAPLPAPGNTIVREPPTVASAPAPAATEPAQAEPTVLEADPEPRAARPSGALSTAPTVSELAANGEIRVAQGQTLSQIARGLGQDAGLDQTMIALLRANPDAFIQGNINLLKAGAVLRVPASAELAQLGESEAAALVREQNAQWRSARAPILQPAATAAATPSASTDTASAPAAAQARLEIAPPAASAATRAGTQSGIDAEGEGDMLANQELTATKEDLAARQSEVEELRAQVTELETLQQQQAQLIALKDSELAAAQQQLAAGQGSLGQPLWLWGGLILLVLGLAVAYMLSRRSKPATAPVKRSGYDSAAMAAAFDAGNRAGASEPAVEGVVAAERSKPAETDLVAELEQQAHAAAETPAWTAAPGKPTWHTGDAAAGIAPMNAAPAGRERLELALAYIDLGDKRTARDLLNEVVAGGDELARDEASQLLRELD